MVTGNEPMSVNKWRLISVNLLVTFVLFNLAYWSLPVLSLLLNIRASITEDGRARLPNYATVTWATQHYREFNQLKSNYKSFIGWRRKEFHGETINIGGRYSQRLTINDGADRSKKAYFFGGSTMWGSGVRDDGTIPSQFAAATGYWSENFGESAYTAHQGLMLLVQLLQDGHRPDVVVFYDGANDVAHKCSVELTPDSHAREAKIQNLLLLPSPTTFAHYFAPVWDAAAQIKAKVIRAIAPAAVESYDCDSKPEKATRIADNLVGDWRMAKRLVETYGGRFVGILQPVSYFSKTRMDHLTDDPAMRAQFRAVYPLVERRMAEVGGFHNMEHALDIDEYVYVDFCHLSANGNGLIAAGIAKFIKL
jgi:lysophospholipase L1-like esterase